jgi:YD repeat-containing protein
MKQFLLFLMALFLVATFATQSQTVQFTYDASGNRTSRIIDLGGGSKGTDTPKDYKEEVKEEEEIVTDDSFSPGPVKIYPNPTRGLIEIEVPVSEDDFELQITVTDINGRKIISKTHEPPRTTIDLSSQPGGMYLLILKQGATYSKWKILKE